MADQYDHRQFHHDEHYDTGHDVIHDHETQILPPLSPAEMDSSLALTTGNATFAVERFSTDNYNNGSSISHSSPSKTPKPGNALPQTDVKYTALRPTGVDEVPIDDDLEENDNYNFENDNFGSSVHLHLPIVRKSRRFSRLCVSLTIVVVSSVIAATFALLFVFVFFPSNKGEVLYPNSQHDKVVALLKKYGSRVAMTSCGFVRGTHEDGVLVFKGIPYAIPPIGRRRWHEPEPRSFDTRTCWKHILNATTFGSPCVQPSFKNSKVVEGNEDCLFLNIWTPSLNPNKNYPVMVWLHSGDLVHGSGNMPGMSPSAEVARATNAVYVSFNYRLGMFGFLALDVLRKLRGGHRSAGNYGIMDQQLALKWIQQNIRNFGGNEFDITVFGHGSGATSIQALLSSHWSQNLFHKAWLSSPIAILNKTLDDACKDSTSVLIKTKCSSASCLRSLSPEALVSASPWSLEPYWTLDQMFHTPENSQIRNDLVIFDGYLVNWSTEKEGPIGVDVSVVLGTTYFEISSLLSEKAVINMTENEFNDLLVHHTSSLGTDTVVQLKGLYATIPHLHYTSPSHFPPHASASLAHLVGDIRNVCPLKLVATAMEFVYNSPIYMYTAEIYPSHNIFLSSSQTNSFVGWDLLAFFHGFDALDFRADQGDINFENLIRQEIMSFVKKGKPISSRWKTVEHNTGIIEKGVTVRPSTSSYFEHCDFWDRHNFFQYSWRDSSQYV